MRNPFGLGMLAGIVLTVAIAAVGGYFVIMNGMLPANADARPGKLEMRLARTSLNATIRREMPSGAVPVALSDQHLLNGIKLYGQNCAVCHGVANGEPTNIAKGFFQRAPQLGKRGVEDDPAGETYWKVTHGIRFTAMPAFSKTLTDRQRWEVTLFLKHMDALPSTVDKVWKALKTS